MSTEYQPRLKKLYQDEVMPALQKEFSIENPMASFEANVAGTARLFQAARDAGVRRVVYASSSSVYGDGEELPKREGREGELLSPYAASKKAAEALCHTYHYLYGLDVTVFRYFTVYGPAGRPDMSLFRFMQWISEGRPGRYRRCR